MGSVPALEKAGLLTGAALEQAKKVTADFNAIVADCVSSKSPVGVLTSRTEALLQENGLWSR